MFLKLESLSGQHSSPMRKLAFSLKILISVIVIINLGMSFTVSAISQSPSSGTLYITDQNQQRYIALSLTTNVEMDINGLTARVRVEQSFKNNQDKWVEGEYQFPLPDKAAVDHLSMQIGERIIVGEIKEKKEAKKTYQQAKISGRKASLIEQQRPNLFSNSIANIAPYETIKVIIEYQQEINYQRKDGFSIRFPMTITPRYQPSQHTQIFTEEFDQGEGFLGKANQASLLPVNFSRDNSASEEKENLVTLSIQLDSGIPLQSLTSPSHKIYNQQKTEREYEIQFSQQQVVADHDFILNWKPMGTLKPRAALFTERKAGENFISMMVMPPTLEDQVNNNIARETVFVIDTSGSMSGESMKQAKNALIFGLSTLSRNDEFNIIQFNSTAEKLFDSSKSASRTNLQIAINYVNSLNADGGTEMYSALQMSLENQGNSNVLRQVIFLTDGAVSNEAELFKLIDSNLGDSRLYTVGIGSAPNAFFMKKAARFGRGSFTFIANIKESQQKIQELFDNISRPQLTHIDVKWPNGISAETWPNKIPDLYDGQPLWLKSKVSRLRGLAEISGRLGNTLWQSRFSLDNPTQQSGIAVLWAREKIASIMNAAFHGQVDQQQQRQIIDTALEHHLVSRFTSLVAVDKTASRIAEQLRKEIIRNAKPKGTKSSSNFSSIHYAATGLDLDIELKNSIFIFAVSLLLMLFSRRFLG